MTNGVLIRKIYMECPLCRRVHEVEERARTVSATMKGTVISYEENFCICTEGNTPSKEVREFQTDVMTNSNMMAARNAFRRAKDLLTADEIVAIRENYGLTQVELARLLGWGEATVARYENKAIQDEAYDTILRIIGDNPLKAIEFLDKNKDKFPEPKRTQIRIRLIEKLDAYGKEFLSRQVLSGEYVKYPAPSDYNGYRLLDIDKIENIISYYAGRIANLNKAKLMKMLWYADALSFRTYGNSLTGLVYRRGISGIVPIGDYSLICLENVIVQEDDFSTYYFYPNPALDAFVLSRNEIAVLDAIIAKFRNYNGADIAAYMREESAYQQTEPEGIVLYSLAGEVRNF